MSIPILSGCTTTFQTYSYNQETISSKNGKIRIYAIPTRIQISNRLYRSEEPYTIHFNYFTKDGAGVETNITIRGISAAESELHGLLDNTPQITTTLPVNSAGNLAKYSASLKSICSGNYPIMLSLQLDYGSDTELFEVELKPVYRESKKNLFVNTIKREF